MVRHHEVTIVFGGETIPSIITLVFSDSIEKGGEILPPATIRATVQAMLGAFNEIDHQGFSGA
jgi:hypothetical protein